jgi:hypothetical protein
MKATPKSKINMAVAASLIGLGAASVTSAPVQAQTVSANNTGQALIYPYYTVNGGWITTMNLINTSDKTLAVKVRFHETKNSRDVLDFVVVMSPHDSWAAYVQDSDNGPEILTNDMSCTSPLAVMDPDVPVYASNFAYTGVNADTGGSGNNRMREGYIEVVVMGEANEIIEPPTDPEFNAADNIADKDTLYVPYHAEHVDGVPRNCDIVDQAFVATSRIWTDAFLPTDARYDEELGCDNSSALPGSGYPLATCDFVAPEGNPLKGNVGWLNASTGYGAGTEAIAVEDWSTALEGPSFVTAQQSPWFLEPTFATNETLWTINVDAFEDAISVDSTMNEWADNPTNGARSDWVVTFPTKAFHVDIFNEQIQAASNKFRNDMEPVVECVDSSNQPSDALEDRTTCEPTNEPITVAPFLYGFGIEADDNGDSKGDSLINVVWELYDREETKAEFVTDGTGVSPAPPATANVAPLPYEANVIQFSGVSVYASNFAQEQAASELLNGAPSGWAKLTFMTSDGTDVTNPDDVQALPGRAFAMRAIDRTLDGQAYQAGYVPEAPVQKAAP